MPPRSRARGRRKTQIFDWQCGEIDRMRQKEDGVLACSFTHFMDQSAVDIECFLDMIDEAEFIGLMTLRRLAWADDCE